MTVAPMSTLALLKLITSRPMGSAGMLPQRSFKKLRAVIANFVFSEQLLMDLCLDFLLLILTSSPNVKQFRWHIFDFSIYTCALMPVTFLGRHCVMPPPPF